MNKFIFMIALCLGSATSFAAGGRVCELGVATAIAPSNDFAKAGFSPKCSANTYVTYAEDANNGAVGAVSKKGNQIFGGHTNGGAVTKAATVCASTGCVQLEADGAATAMLAASSS
jgi:hypothetical protein